MARSFNGTTDKIVIADSATTSIFAGNFSIGLWFYLNALSSTCLVVKGTNVLNMDVCLAAASATQGYFAAGNEAGGSVSGTSVFAVSTWTYMMMTRASGATITIYVNDMSTAWGSRTGANNADSNQASQMGVSPVVGLNTLNGRLANLVIYDRGLSAAERVQCMAGCPVPTSGLQAYLPLGLASPETDLSGNNNTGAVTGASQVDSPVPACLTAGGPVPIIGPIHPIYPIFNR